jgi:hypothetical protein
VLPKSVILDVLAEYKTTVSAAQYAAAETKVLAIMNGKSNLRLLLSGLNSSKGARNAAAWKLTPIGGDVNQVNQTYLSSVSRIQQRNAAKIEKILGPNPGGEDWFFKFFNPS